jgi:hypothetical protein
MRGKSKAEKVIAADVAERVRKLQAERREIDAEIERLSLVAAGDIDVAAEKLSKAILGKAFDFGASTYVMYHGVAVVDGSLRIDREDVAYSNYPRWSRAEYHHCLNYLPSLSSLTNNGKGIPVEEFMDAVAGVCALMTLPKCRRRPGPRAVSLAERQSTRRR